MYCRAATACLPVQLFQEVCSCSQQLPRAEPHAPLQLLPQLLQLHGSCMALHGPWPCMATLKIAPSSHQSGLMAGETESLWAANMRPDLMSRPAQAGTASAPVHQATTSGAAYAHDGARIRLHPRQALVLHDERGEQRVPVHNHCRQERGSLLVRVCALKAVRDRREAPGRQGGPSPLACSQQAAHQSHRR